MAEVLQINFCSCSIFPFFLGHPQIIQKSYYLFKNVPALMTANVNVRSHKSVPADNFTIIASIWPWYGRQQNSQEGISARHTCDTHTTSGDAWNLRDWPSCSKCKTKKFSRRYQAYTEMLVGYPVGEELAFHAVKRIQVPEVDCQPQRE